MGKSSNHKKLKNLVETRKQHARMLNELQGLTQKQIANKHLHKIYANPTQYLQHATEVRGHFNREGDFIEAPIGITTTGVWNNNTAHAVKVVPPNNAVFKFNMTKYSHKPLSVMGESTRSRSRSKSASPKPASPNLDIIEQERKKRDNARAKFAKNKELAKIKKLAKNKEDAKIKEDAKFKEIAKFLAQKAIYNDNIRRQTQKNNKKQYAEWREAGAILETKENNNEK